MSISTARSDYVLFLGRAAPADKMEENMTSATTDHDALAPGPTLPGVPAPAPASAGGTAAATTSAVITVGYGLAIRAAGVPMKAGFLGAVKASTLKISSFATGTIICTFWATILAVILARCATDASRDFTRTTLVLTAISLAVPVDATHTATTTKAALIGSHLLAAGIVIPTLCRALSFHSNPGMPRRLVNDAP
jgi:hypothetical protein